MATKKSDSTKKEEPAASPSTKASTIRKKKTAEIVEEVSPYSEELDQSPAPVQGNQEQPQEMKSFNLCFLPLRSLRRTLHRRYHLGSLHRQ